MGEKIATAWRDCRIHILLGEAGSRRWEDCSEKRVRLEILIDCEFRGLHKLGKGEIWRLFISSDWGKKLPQTEQLKTTKIYFLTLLEAKSPNSVSLSWNQGDCRAAFIPEALKANLFLASFSCWWRLAILGFWPRDSNLCLFLIRVPLRALGPTYLFNLG